LSTALKINNIGGLSGTVDFTLKKGLNIIQAPNAVGKTSIIKALRAIVLPEAELREQRHYLNYFAMHGEVAVENLEGKSGARKLRSANGGLFVSGEPIFPEGKKADVFAMAIPENDLLNLTISGKPLEPIFEEFSDAKFYRFAADWLKQRHEETLGVLDRQREDMVHFEQLRRTLGEQKDKLKKLQAEEKKLPGVEETRAKAMMELSKELREKLEKESNLKSSIGTAKVRLQSNNDELKRNKELAEHYHSQITRFEQEHPHLEEETSKMQDEIDKKRQKKAAYQSDIDVFQAQLDATRDVIVKGKRFRKPICFCCGREFSEAEQRRREAALEKELVERRKEIARTTSEIEALEEQRDALREDRIRVKTEFQKNLHDTNKRIEFLESDISKLTKDITQKNDLLGKLRAELETLEKGVDRNLLSLYRKRGELEGDIKIAEAQIETINRRLQELSGVEARIRDATDREEFLKMASRYFADKATEVKEAIRGTFNKAVMETYNLLGFTDFQKIYLDEMFHIQVIRLQRGRTVRQPIESLSTSERTTIAIILMLAGKQEYLPEFPMFILDELTTSYDPTRFKEIINYLQKTTPYTIVTALAPYERQKEIEILYGPQALSR